MTNSITPGPASKLQVAVMSRVTCCFKKLECPSRARRVLLSSMIIVLQKVRLHGRHIASHGYSLDQKIAALPFSVLFSVLFILAGQNICCSFFLKNRGKEVRVLELILGWQVSTASILLSAESSCFFRCFAISHYITITAIYLNLRCYQLASACIKL